MPRRSIERPAPSASDIIDMKTGRPAAVTPIPAICKKIRFYRERAGIEQKALAKAIGITSNAISNWENGRGRPDLNLLPELCKALHVTMYELFGEDDPSGQYSASEKSLVSRYRSLTPGHKVAVGQLMDTLLQIQSAENAPSVRKLTFFAKSLAAGYGDPSEFEDEGTPIYLYSSRQADRADCVFTVNGDSMEPAYHNGDMVLVSRIPDAPALQDGEVGAFIVGNETYIKVSRPDGLHSLNPRYAPMHFEDTEAVYLIGRVIGILDPSQIASEADAEKFRLLHPEEQESGRSGASFA